jgi:Tfp pilus assembly protein PilO
MSAKSNEDSRRAPRSWLITALLASLAIAYVAFVFVPEQRRIGALQGELHERRQHILQAHSLTIPVERATEQLAKTHAISAAWREESIDSDEISHALAKISSLADAAGVAIERLDPQKPTELESLAQHEFVVHLRGRFPEMFEFVRHAEQLPGSVWISNLRLTSDPPTAPAVRGEMTLTIFTDYADSSDSAAAAFR